MIKDMSPISQPLLIISRDALMDERANGAVFRHLASLTRRGWHLILTASEPDQWFPTRHSEDNLLTTQAQLQALIHEFGGGVDGVYYVPRSEFSQDRNREGALSDILRRYGCEAGNATLFSTSEPFLRAAERLGISTSAIDERRGGSRSLEALLRALATEEAA